MRTRTLRVAVAALAACGVALSLPAVAQAARAPEQTVLVAAGVSTPAGAHDLGPAASATPVSFDVYLQPRDSAALTAYAQAVTDRHSSQFGHYLARGEFQARFGAAPATVAALERALRGAGLRVQSALVDGLGVRASGSAGAVDHLFHATLDRYRLADGRAAVAAPDGLRLPASVASTVLGVIGLDTLVAPASSTTTVHATLRPLSHIKWPAGTHTGRTFATRPATSPGAPSACPVATSATEEGFGGITDDQVAGAYGFGLPYGQGDLGAGQTVAIFELEPFAMSDVAGFDECYFGADHTSNITVTNVDGGPGAGYGSGESALDIENVSALAPDAHIHVYQAQDTEQGATDAYGQIVADDTAQVVSTSWGACEATMVADAPGTLDVEHLLFEQAAAQGQSVFAAAGDDGADDCAEHASFPVAPYLSVDDPASQPYVVSVGGTTAESVTQPPAEQVWNDGSSGGAGGGGISSLWPMPSWQSQVSSVRGFGSSTCGTGTSRCRVTPDVAAFADEYTGITIEIAGGWYTIGGTSSSAPIWAATLAEVNASTACQSSSTTAHGVGFVSPLLYEVGANPTQDAESFNDVTSGNNDVFSINEGAYGATAGYDLASGWGSPDLTGDGGTGLAQALCTDAQEATTSALTSVEPSAGTTAGGTPVTITGTGFKTGSTVNVTGVSFGDYPAASFTVTSATTITAVTAPAGVPKLLGKTVRAGAEGLVEVDYASGHVATGPTFHFVAPSAGSLVPVVDSVGPSGGPVAGGTTVTIYGTGLAGATGVDFGGVPATNVHVLSDDELAATSPPQGAATCLGVSHTAASRLCQSTVTVTTPQGTSATITPLKPLQGYLDYNNDGVPYAPARCDCEIYPTPTEYDYQAAPTFTKLVNQSTSKQMPLADPEFGSFFSITGTGFNWLTLNYVSFGNGSQLANQDVSIELVTYTGIELFGLADDAPSPSGNNVPIRVVSQGGTSRALDVYFAGIPKVTGISADVLPSAGGATLDLTGAGLTYAIDVQFYSVFGLASTYVLSNYKVLGPTEIRVRTPSLTPGSYFVSVDNLYGNSSIYTQSLPGEGPNAPFETLPYTRTVVAVTYPGGAALTGSSPNTCSVSGGCVMTLTGVNLGPADQMAAYVGDQAATIDTVDGNTVTITVPPSFLGRVGTYEVFLTTANGQTPDTLDALLTYY